MLVCVSNSLPDLRPCTVKGAHLVSCGGFATRWDREQQRRLTTKRPCTGCLPRPAESGVLCYSCGAKLDEALKVAVDLITHLRSIESGPKADDGIRSAPGSRVILPVSWVEADNLYTSLAAVAVAFSVDWGVPEPEWDVTASLHAGFHPEASLGNVWGVTRLLVEYVVDAQPRLLAKFHAAGEAVRFVRQMQTALAHYPLEEKARPVRYVRCRTCDQQSLRWRPPLEFEDAITIECSNPNCGNVWDPAMVQFDLRVMAQEIEEAAALDAVEGKN